MKVKTLYEERYKAHALRVKSHLLPTLPHVDSTGFTVDSAYVLRAGRAEVDGIELEYQELRVYFKERPQ
jgi:hypothetical protein